MFFLIPLLTRLNNLSKAHDWTYRYSDDQSAWRRGRDSSAAIRNLAVFLLGKGVSASVVRHTIYQHSQGFSL